MPELPEVETIKRQLALKVKGLKINKIDVLKPKLFKGNIDDVVGATIKEVTRRAKMFIIDLDNHRHLLIHLKMTGQLIFVDKDGLYGGGHPIPPFNLKVPNQYSHIIIDFQDGSKLYFNDLRQFGWIKVLTDNELIQEFEKTGIEPFDKEFTLERFGEILSSKKKSPIKLVLMDQGLIVGIGNIYANEICFLAQVMPDRKVVTLTQEEIKKIYDAIFVILNKAIKFQGTSAVDYVTLEGKQGSYDEHLMIYGKAGESCPEKCGGKIEKIKLGGRGTFFCSSCQK